MTLLESISPLSRELLVKSPRFKVQSPKSKVRTPRERFDAAIKIPSPFLRIASRCVRSAKVEEDRLRYLGQLFGDLSREILYPHGRGTKEALQKMFALTIYWIAGIQGTNDFWPVIEATFAERQRQDKLQRDQPDKYPFALSSPIPDTRRKLRVIFEECGEVADALDKLERATRHEVRWARYDLGMELIQTAACCAAWLESFEAANGGAR